MATHRQLPNDIDIAPFQSKGRWYKAFIEKDESGNAKLTNADAGLPSITPTGYGFTMDGQKNGKDFHLVSAVANPGIGTGTAGSPAFYYPTIGQNYTAEGSQYIVDFNKPETNVSLKINDTAATVQETVNGLVQKNIALSASVESGGDYYPIYFLQMDDALQTNMNEDLSDIFSSIFVSSYKVCVIQMNSNLYIYPMQAMGGNYFSTVISPSVSNKGEIAGKFFFTFTLNNNTYTISNLKSHSQQIQEDLTFGELVTTDIEIPSNATTGIVLYPLCPFSAYRS